MAMKALYTINEGEKSLLASVQLWMSRLQLVMAVTAFFASTDGLLLGRVGAYVPDDTSVGNILTHTALSGALAFHISAAIIAYLASFVLVKYNKISIPTSEEASIASLAQRGQDATIRTRGGSVKTSQLDPPIGLQSLHQRGITDISDHMVTIERVYLRNFLRTRPSGSMFYASASKPETVTAPELQDAYTVLLRCNNVCVILTFVGLSLAIIGVMAYVWTTFTLVPGIFVSVCFVISLAAACYALR